MMQVNDIAERPVLLKATGLARSFGPVQAVRDFSCELRAGTIVGFIGMNGAGKTTSLRMLATLEYPDAGQIQIEGVDVVDEPHLAKLKIGWMPDAFMPYTRMTVQEYLQFFAIAHGLRGKRLAQRLESIIEFTGLAHLLSRPSMKLSKGETQRLSLARMLIQDPSVILMDEPAAGLDPRARVEFRDLVRALRDQGKALFISSHILSDMEELCDDLVFINDGAVLHHGTHESMQAGTESGQRLRIRIAGSAAEWIEWIQLQPGMTLVESLNDGGVVALSASGQSAAAAGLAQMVRAGHLVCEFQRLEARLEDTFLRIVAGERRDK